MGELFVTHGPRMLETVEPAAPRLSRADATHVADIEGLSQADLYSLIGPSGLSMSMGQDRYAGYRVEGVVDVDVSAEVPAGVVRVYCVGEDTEERLQTWLGAHFDSLYTARAATERTLRESRGRRIA